jgi:hypothetical protein
MKTLHIVHGSGQPPVRAGACVRIIDDLSEGPLHHDRGEHQRLRTAIRGEAIRDLENLREAVSGIRSFDEIVVWAGPTPQEQLMLPWAVPLLCLLGVPQGAITLACPRDRHDQPVDSRAAEGRDMVRGYMARRSLDTYTELLLRRLWEALTADTPRPLLAFSERDLRALPLWAPVREAFLARYPDATGLGFHDRVILSNCSRRWRPAAKVIDDIVKYADDLARITPDNAWRRLLRMVGRDERTSAVGLRCEGHLTPVDCEVRLTELGAQGVDGSIDILTRMPLCEWIGGVLIQSPERVWRWTERGLEPDRPELEPQAVPTPPDELVESPRLGLPERPLPAFGALAR